MIPRLHGKVISVHALLHLRALRRVASAKLPTDYGKFDIHVCKSAFSTKAHVAPLSAVAARGVKQIAGQARRMNPREHVFAVADRAEHQSVSERLPIEIPPTASTSRYLKKKEKLGHLLSSV